MIKTLKRVTNKRLLILKSTVSLQQTLWNLLWRVNKLHESRIKKMNFLDNNEVTDVVIAGWVVRPEAQSCHKLRFC